MLQYINDLPDDVVGIHAIGEVTKDDIDKVLLPRLDELAGRQGEIKSCWCLRQMLPTLQLPPGGV
jgi:hypothetical protein